MHMERKLYVELANVIQARKNCLQATVNTEWYNRHSDTIKMLVGLLPSGSGIDHGTHIDLEASHSDKLTFQADYHHMNDGGFYDGWTEHSIIVTPSFRGINLRISGRNRNDIKDYLYETYEYALQQDVSYHLLVAVYPELKVTSKWIDSCTQVFYVSGNEFKTLTNAMLYAVECAENLKNKA